MNECEGKKTTILRYLVPGYYLSFGLRTKLLAPRFEGLNLASQWNGLPCPPNLSRLSSTAFSRTASLGFAGFVDIDVGAFSETAERTKKTSAFVPIVLKVVDFILFFVNFDFRKVIFLAQTQQPSSS